MTLTRWVLRLSGGLVIVWSAGFLFFAGLATQPAGEPATADGIVALTGGELRIEEAVRLLSTHRAQRLLISGVNSRTSRAALQQQMSDYAGLFDCCIDIGYWAQDTVGNAQETMVWAQRHGFKRLIVVTSGYHMARSLAEIAQAYPDAELIPHPVLTQAQHTDAWWTSPSLTRLLMIEYVKLWPALTRLGLARIFGPQGASTSESSQSQSQSKASVN